MFTKGYGFTTADIELHKGTSRHSPQLIVYVVVKPADDEVVRFRSARGAESRGHFEVVDRILSLNDRRVGGVCHS